MRRGPVRRGNLVSGALLAALGVYIVVEARQWEYLGVDGPGPGFFPLWYGLAMIALSLGLMASFEDGFQKSGEFAKSIERYSEEMRSILGDAGVRLVR